MAKIAYHGSKIEVTYDEDICIHAGECVRGLPRVFDTNKDPWITPDGASAEEVAAQVRRCPSGALQYRMLD
ncbi:MAG: (4Fe-4S)-binding protein [Mycobacterium sp.]